MFRLIPKAPMPLIFLLQFKAFSARATHATVFVLLSLLILNSNPLSANNPLSAKVDRNKLSENETLELIIRYEDSRVSGTPELNGLEKQFDILNRNQSSSFSFGNGKKNSYTEWQYTLMPKKTGQIIIPSFSLNGHFSDAITLDIVPENRNLNQSQPLPDVFIESFTDKTKAYAQEIITLTFRINTAIQIARPELKEFNIPDFMVHSLGQSRYQTVLRGKQYLVYEYRFALFASKSGNYVIPAERYQIAEIIGNQNRSSFFIPGFNSTRARYLKSQEITLKIEPPLATPENALWLPATHFNISDSLPAQQSLEVGTPITRTITMKAIGNTSAAIPPLNTPSVPGLKIYPEPANLDNQSNNDRLLGTRIETQAIIPTASGSYHLPAITVHWWDTQAQTFRSSTIPEKILQVTPAANPATRSAATPMSSAAAEQNINHLQQDSLTAAAPTQPKPSLPESSNIQQPESQQATATSSDDHSLPPIMLALFIISGFIIVAGAFYIQKLKQEIARLQAQHSGHESTPTNSSRPQQLDLKELEHQFTTAKADENWPLLRQLFTQACQNPNSSLHKLQDYSADSSRLEAQQLINMLDQLAYATAGTNSFKKTIQDIDFKKFIAITSTQKTIPNTKLEALPPLYPQSSNHNNPNH